MLSDPTLPLTELKMSSEGQLGFPPHNHQSLPPLKSHLGRHEITRASLAPPLIPWHWAAVYKLIYCELYKVSSRESRVLLILQCIYQSVLMVTNFLIHGDSHTKLTIGRRAWFDEPWSRQEEAEEERGDRKKGSCFWWWEWRSFEGKTSKVHDHYD